jgi:hypothetical protein
MSMETPNTDGFELPRQRAASKVLLSMEWMAIAQQTGSYAS